MQRVKLQAAVQQSPRLPDQVNLARLHHQAVFFPAQQANVPALAQGATHVLCHQHLAQWQVA